MANMKLDRIVKDIGQYFGIRSQIVLKSTDSNSLSSVDVNRSFLSQESNEFLKLLMSKSNTAPYSQSVIDEAVKIDSVPLLITPKDSNVNNGADNFLKSNVCNRKDKNHTKQGTHNESGKFYTMEDLFGESTPNITVFQNFSPVNSAGSIDTDIVSLYMKTASSLEMSRAVPYLEIGIAGAVNKKDGGGIDKSKNYTFLGRFLGLGSNQESDLKFYNADTDPYKRNPRFDPVDALEENGRTLTILGGMESFTAPQTMINANRTHANSNEAVLDQFQPFMSLMSLRLSVVGQGGLMSFKSGNLELLLHDRARMNEIGSLISPDRFGNTRIIITYGWSHPDGSTVSRGGNANIIDNKIGELIDSMKVTETYLISNSKFSFDQSTVKISLSIAMLGGKTLSEMDVSLVLEGDIGTRIEQLKEELQNLSNLLNELNREKSANKITTISVPTFLRNPESLKTANQESIVKSITDLRAAFNQQNESEKSISETLSRLFSSTLKADAANNGGFSSDSSGDIVQLINNFAAEIDRYVDKLKQLPDPFLPSTLDADRSQHVSLGKILTCFLGNAFHKQFKESVDMQVFFHPFNHEAGRLNDYNISQFYFSWEDFKNVLKNQYSPFGKMSFGKFFNLIQQYFINDLGGPAYNFLDQAQRDTFARNPENLAARGKKEKDKFEAKAYEQALEQNKGKRLKLAYYNSETDKRSAGFKLPQLSIDLQSIPLRKDWVEQANTGNFAESIPTTVIRLHVMDRCCEGLYTASELIRSSPGRTFSRLVRETQPSRSDTLYRSNHSRYSDAPIAVLESSGFLKRLDDYLDQKSSNGKSKFEELLQQMAASEIEEIKKILRENYLIFDASSYAVKDLIKGVFPSLDYGTLGSGIMKASVSSIDDSGLATIMLIRGGQGAKGSDSDESISSVPMAVMPSAVSLDTIGCPYFSFAQFFFIDFGTNTNIDNVYAVTGIDHVIEPGKFQTNVKMTWSDSFAVFRPLDDSMREAALKAILQRLGVFKNQSS
jgi:hypothetical protein